ncbi:hypothetical protein E2562_009086 [Oryza meyeriana var. granulata]|uniref:Uncharacterized protein n=1 Tax=Oryza meyeriana var. granulata TaxID=110450 RepID=A0A6G1D104_9ORYZ|nr:hypothetical protein E2562_009086 [Oryza meyeriana var. granulata]
MEWGGALRGMSPWEVVNALLLTVHSRHTRESIINLATLSPAILVLFVLTRVSVWFNQTQASFAAWR